MLRSLVGSEMCIRDRCWVCLDAFGDVCAMESTQKVKLTTMLIEMRRAGDHAPMVTSKLIEEAKIADPLPVYTRAERLLRYLVNSALHVGQSFRNNILFDDLEALAWSESTTSNDISYFINYLTEMGWLRSNRSGGFIITCLLYTSPSPRDS